MLPVRSLAGFCLSVLLLCQSPVFAETEGAAESEPLAAQISAQAGGRTIPVLMAARSQRNVPLNPAWLTGYPADTSTVLNDAQVYELVTHTLAEAEGFGDWTSKRIAVAYAAPEGRLRLFRCDLNRPDKRCRSREGLSLDSVKALYVYYNKSEIIADNLWRGLTNIVSFIGVVLPLAIDD